MPNYVQYPASRVMSVFKRAFAKPSTESKVTVTHNLTRDSSIPAWMPNRRGGNRKGTVNRVRIEDVSLDEVVPVELSDADIGLYDVVLSHPDPNINSRKHFEFWQVVLELYPGIQHVIRPNGRFAFIASVPKRKQKTVVYSMGNWIDAPIFFKDCCTFLVSWSIYGKDELTRLRKPVVPRLVNHAGRIDPDFPEMSIWGGNVISARVGTRTRTFSFSKRRTFEEACDLSKLAIIQMREAVASGELIARKPLSR